MNTTLWKKMAFGIAFTIALSACGNAVNAPDGGDGDGSGDGSGDGTANDACAGSPALTTGQAASVVIGQPDFITGTTSSASASTLNFPSGSMAVVSGKLWIPDYQNNRIVGFNTIPTTNGAEASLVLGQPNMTESSGGTTSALFANPAGIQSYGGKFYTLEEGNGRILGFNSMPTQNGQEADFVVVGPADMNQSSSELCNAFTLKVPSSFAIVGGKLIVADAGNDRVLIWNSIPTAGTAADIVLGQPDFITCTSTTSTGTPSATKFAYASFVSSDGTSLVVTDQQFNRALIWNSLPTSNNQEADVVVGQSGFTAKATGAGETGLSASSAAIIHASKLYVADTGNNRVLIFNSLPSTNGAAADLVLGQPDMTTNTNGTSATALSSPVSVMACGTQLFVMETDNQRVLIFE